MGAVHPFPVDHQDTLKQDRLSLCSKETHHGDTKPRLLVVDDAPSNIRILLAILRDFYTVATATSGSKALSLANSTPQPDLILLDIMMPEMDGFEVCLKLKANPTTWAIPVLFITALSDEQS